MVEHLKKAYKFSTYMPEIIGQISVGRAYFRAGIALHGYASVSTKPTGHCSA